MKKQRRLLLCIMALAIVAGNVAGCSAGDTPETRATAPPGTEAAADTTGAADVPETKDHSYTEPEATYENGSAYEPFGTPFSFEVPSDDGTVTFSVQVPDNYPVYISVNGDGHDFYELKDGTEVMLGYLDGAKAGSLEEVFTDHPDRRRGPDRQLRGCNGPQHHRDPAQ